MASVLRFNSDDQRITYSPGWTTEVGQNGHFSFTSTLGAEFFFLFRGIVHFKWPTHYFFSSSWSLIRVSPSGTSVRVYVVATSWGDPSGGKVELRIVLDSNYLISTVTNNGTTLVWNADNLGDGDHQLYATVTSLQHMGFGVDYFEYVVPLLHVVTRIVLQQDFCCQG